MHGRRRTSGSGPKSSYNKLRGSTLILRALDGSITAQLELNRKVVASFGSQRHRCWWGSHFLNTARVSLTALEDGLRMVEGEVVIVP